MAHSIFNIKVYNQIDGVAKGSLLVPLFSNISMIFYETKWLHEYNCDKFYLRYDGETLAPFGKEQDSLNSLYFFK